MREEKTFDYRNYIQSRLKEIDDLDERREARDLLLDSLAHIFEWTEAKYAELEQRIQDELKLPWQYYNVFMTIIKRGDYDAINPFWHPVCEEDISSAPKKEYSTVFLMADEGCCREFLAQGTVEGVDEAGGNHIRFHIRTCERYGERMKTLYHLFAGNHIPWQTVHMGYAERFFDLVPEEDTLAGENIRFLWGKWEKYVHEDMILLWNIERFMMQSQEYRHPCLDEAIYEHIYYLGSDREEMDGYLVETDDDILSVRFEENKILIKTQQETLEEVFLYRLYQGDQGSSYGYHFPVLSNCKKDNLAVRYLQETGNFIQTPMELYRKIEELSAGYPVRVTGYEITDHAEGAVMEGDMNRHIGMQLFSNDNRKILLFQFQREEVMQDAYLYESQIRYILSQLQLEFLEYRCMGGVGMNYAWEAVLLAEKNKKERDNLRFVEAVCPSPYIEVSVTDLNTQTIEEDRIEINPLYRFEKVFGRLFDKNITDMQDTRALLFDICMHYIVQLDLREGLTKEDFYESRIAADIQGGIYGEAALKRFRLFRKSEQKIILRACLMLMKSGDYMTSFKTAVTGVYPHACIYENNETAYELLVYLGADETDEERERADFLKEMFLPIQEMVYFFYEYHFGVIGVDETMMVDEMVLF